MTHEERSVMGRKTMGGRILALGAVGALAAGAIAAAIGVRGALWVLMTCFALSAALLATPAIRSARDLPAAGGGPEPGRPVMAPRPFRQGRAGQIIGLERGSSARARRTAENGGAATRRDGAMSQPGASAPS